MRPKCQLALQRDEVVDIHRLIDVKNLLPFDQQLDEIFACGDILSSLDSHVVMQDIEALKDGVSMNVQALIFLVKLCNTLCAVRLPLLVISVIVDALDYGKDYFYSTVEDCFFYLEIHFFLRS